MPTQHSIREFGYIGKQAGEKLLLGNQQVVAADSNQDYCEVPTVCFEFLKDRYALNPPDKKPEFLRLRKCNGREALQAVNYVGLLQTPAGTQLEILPKTTTINKVTNQAVIKQISPVQEGIEQTSTLQASTHQAESNQAIITQARARLWKMLMVAYDIRGQVGSLGSLSTLQDRWLEALIKLVLNQIGLVIKQGIRNLYVRQDSVSTFLKGQLRVAAQMRARPGTEHKFAISYDQFTPDRAENRLIKSCLLLLNRWTNNLESKRLCKQYLFVFDEVPPSINHIEDLKLWRTNRNMAYYQPLLPWLRLILNNRAPVLSPGGFEGISLLFPMERLFERYVEILLRRQLMPGLKLVAQAQDQALVTHNGREWFKLRPDLLIKAGNTNKTVLDTKWKLLDSSKNDSRDKYNINQGDFYQMLAYGEKYLNGNGNMALIYPRHDAFHEPLPVFSFSDQLHLWGLPFDLDEGMLIYPSNELHFKNILVPY